MTVHRWQHYAAVLQRAECLSKQNRLPGVLVARSSWERVVRALVKKAITGDIPAARFVYEIAWTEDTPADDTPREVALTVVYDDESR